MNNNQLLGIGIVIVLVFVLFMSSRHHKRPRRIGGCKGTEYGCCPNGKTACNRRCSNCFYS